MANDDDEPTTTIAESSESAPSPPDPEISVPAVVEEESPPSAEGGGNGGMLQPLLTQDQQQQATTNDGLGDGANNNAEDAAGILSTFPPHRSSSSGSCTNFICSPLFGVLLLIALMLLIIVSSLQIPPIPPKGTATPSVSIGVDVHGHSVDMPLLGAGTWQYNDTIAYESVCKAFKAGYTFVDTAFGYGNQKGVGKAIRDCWNKSRSELFVMTKIPGGLNATQVWALHKQNLFELGLTYVDHLMTHFPADWAMSKSKASSVMRQEEWLALEHVYYTGQARTIGISHYCSNHIDDILSIATVTPSINQVEYHVGSGDVDGVIQKCRDSNITFMSFSPLCGPCHLKSKDDSLITGKLVTEIGKKYNVTGSQVSLRFIVQQALQNNKTFMGGVIPKSNNADHIALNKDIFSFSLSEDDMNRLHNATQPAAELGDCNVL